MADENAPQEESGEKKKKGGKLKLIIILLILIILLAGGGFVAMKMFMGGKEEPADKKGSKNAKVEKKMAEPGPLYAFDTFIVNLADGAGQRYLKVTLQVELSNEDKILEDVEKAKPRLRDAIITVLSSKKYEEVSTQQGKVILKKELIRRLNDLMPKGEVMQVYFMEFVSQ